VEVTFGFFIENNEYIGAKYKNPLSIVEGILY
jgi:hypothetical protein